MQEKVKKRPKRISRQRQRRQRRMHTLSTRYSLDTGTPQADSQLCVFAFHHHCQLTPSSYHPELPASQMSQYVTPSCASQARACLLLHPTTKATTVTRPYACQCVYICAATSQRICYNTSIHGELTCLHLLPQNNLHVIVQYATQLIGIGILVNVATI